MKSGTTSSWAKLLPPAAAAYHRTPLQQCGASSSSGIPGTCGCAVCTCVLQWKVLSYARLGGASASTCNPHSGWGLTPPKQAKFISNKNNLVLRWEHVTRQDLEVVWHALSNPLAVGSRVLPKYYASTFRMCYAVQTSGKDLVGNHLSFSIFHHTAIWGEQPQLWPRSIRCNGHLMLNSTKMSKSTGQLAHLQAAILSESMLGWVHTCKCSTQTSRHSKSESKQNGGMKACNLADWCPCLWSISCDAKCSSAAGTDARLRGQA